MNKPINVEEYISGYPKEIQKIIEQVRMTIQKAAPDAEEVISYGMPAYKLNGMLVWFAAHSKHIGFYPKTTGIVKFKKELSVYKSAKGSVQFPFDEPVPLKLISTIVKYRVQENMLNAKLKKKK